MKPSVRTKSLGVYGGLAAAAAFLVRRLILLLQAGWSAAGSLGGLLHTLLDLLVGALLLLVFLPLRRGRTIGIRSVVYALAALAVKASWSAWDWGDFPLPFTLADLGLSTLGVACLLAALAVVRQAEEDGR